MTTSRFEFMVCLSSLLVVHLNPGNAVGQRYLQSRSRPPASNLETQSQRQFAPQRTAQRSVPQRQNRRPTASRQTRTATSSSPQQQPLSQPKVLEKADPEARAAFLKLMGANWIWSPAYPQDEVPVGDCYFRKSFQITQAEVAQVHVACDNQYELYVNGRLAGQGADWRKMDVHDIAVYLLPGENVVAIKATNTDAGPAGLVARVVIKERLSGNDRTASNSTFCCIYILESACRD